MDQAYDQGLITGGYRGYIDEISIINSPVFIATGFEGADPSLQWTNTAETLGAPAGGLLHVGGICCSLPGPEAGTRNETTHNGSTALLYSGNDTSTSASYAYMQLYDLTSYNITVGPATKLEYWVYPQDASQSNLVSGNNSTCVALDLIFKDSNNNLTNLRDSGATDQNGNLIHPASQCGKLTLDTWNHVIVNLGSVKNGTTIIRMDQAYDQGPNTGGYRGYIDDISVHN